MTGPPRDPVIHLRRVYEPADPAAGTRLLVERLWPRGVTKERAALDAWLRDVAPSAELRAWYGHEPARWETFRTRYRAELDALGSPVEDLLAHVGRGPVTFLFAARDVDRNSAVVLRAWVLERLGRA